MADNPFITWVTFGIAVIGAVQPAAIYLYRRNFQKRHVCVFESGAPDIGFFASGPTLGIMGLIRSENAQSVIRDMQLTLGRDDGANLVLRAMGNRKREIALDGSAMQQRFQASQWTPFQIDADAAMPFDINFASEEAARPLQLSLMVFARAWTAYATAAAAAANQVFSSDEERLRFLLPLYQNAHLPEAQAAREHMRNGVFWRSGTFSMTLAVAIDDDPQPVSKSWRVTLTDDDMAALDANIDLALALAAGFPSQIFGVPQNVTPDFQPNPA